MTAFKKPHTCRHCWSTFDASAPGARWKNAKGNPRYIHPNCPKGAKPGKGWTQEDSRLDAQHLN